MGMGDMADRANRRNKAYRAYRANRANRAGRGDRANGLIGVTGRVCLISGDKKTGLWGCNCGIFSNFACYGADEKDTGVSCA